MSGVPLPAPTGVGMGTAVGEAPEVGTFSSVLQFGTGLAKALSTESAAGDPAAYAVAERAPYGCGSNTSIAASSLSFDGAAT